MAREIITTGKSVEEAAKKAYAELGMPEEKCAIEVLEKPKKSIFGKIKVEAKIKVTVKEILKVDTTVTAAMPVTTEKKLVVEPVCEPQSAATQTVEVKDLDSQKENNNDRKLEAATEYLTEILIKMGLENVEIKVTKKDESAVLTLIGENLGILIGRHGETLDAMQYLTSLVCNRVEGTYYRITLDCGNYRDKREEALQELAMKISAKVKRTGRSQILEPMNPYERRIIHSVLSNVDGVESKSKGDEPNRRIVILPTGRNARPMAKEAPRREVKPTYQSNVPERTMEQILKGQSATEPRKLTAEQKMERPSKPTRTTTFRPNTNVAPASKKTSETTENTDKKVSDIVAEKEKSTKLYGKIEL